MTVVGKILVFLNLVFSLVVGGFAVLDYAARTNWARSYDDLKAQNQVIVGALNTYRDDAGRLNLEKDELYKALESKRVQFDKEGKDGKDVQVAEETVSKRATCTPEQRAKVKEAVAAYLKAGPQVLPADAAAGGPVPAAPGAPAAPVATPTSAPAKK